MAKKIYKWNGNYVPTFKCITQAGGKEMTEKIVAEAEVLYAKLKDEHPELSKTARMHWLQCCERGAFYLTIKKYYPEHAYDWIDVSMQMYGAKVAQSLNKMMRLPGMKGRFLPIMRTMANKVFGEAGGFKNHMGYFDKQETHFDILECPYCKYMVELGCPELGPSFCKSDEYSYGNLADFTFERTQTLATGGEKCDFCMRRR